MQFHMLTLFSGISPPHFKQRENPFPSSFAKPFIGSTAYRLSAIRSFPFPAVKHSPSCRQRKRSLGFASDDDTRRMRFPHTLSLHDARDIHSLHCHFERSREILLALCSSLPLSRKASNFTLSHIRRYTGVQERSLGFARDDDTGIALSNHIRWTLREINPFPHTVISSAARNLPCTLLFLASFAKGFPFSAVSHTALYRCARKIPRLRSG